MLAKFLSNNSGTTAVTYVDDVFSAYTYTGNGSTQTITNGIDLSGQGGMVWCKRRDSAQSHGLFDSVTGLSSSLNSTSTAAQIATSPDITSFNSDGVTYGAPGSYIYNFSGGTYVNWTFRKAPKFFDVVTWTGNATNRTISHSLGQEVGLMFVKRTDSAADWQVYHRSLANTEYMVLNSTAAKATGATRWNSTTPTTSVFSVGTDTTVNASGGTYVAYLFSHDTGTDGIVQCGSFTTDVSGNATVTLGWEPQYLMIKSASGVNGWWVFDAARGLPAAPTTVVPFISANAASAEASFGANIGPMATGFAHNGAALGASVTYVYMAIRRPNKPPTVGTQVYNAIARTGTGAAATVTGVGFAPDLAMMKCRSNNTGYSPLATKLIGYDGLNTNSANAELAASSLQGEPSSWGMDGITVTADAGGQANYSGWTYVNHFFKRAPGVFDIVCYTGNSATQNISHSLQSVPELIITKSRSQVTQWCVYHQALSANGSVYLNLTDAYAVNSTLFNATVPTSSVFSLGATTITNGNTTTYVAYLFATKAGISKVFSYTGNGSSQTINCGFTTGARFILIKRTDSTGDWFVWDTVRGIIAGNDPHLSLNASTAEVTTDDSVDSDTTGFIVNQLAATNINVTSATYIGLAFA